jgi:hypothetical protein
MPGHAVIATSLHAQPWLNPPNAPQAVNGCGPSGCNATPAAPTFNNGPAPAP